jgi:hypothetical protein
MNDDSANCPSETFPSRDSRVAFHRQETAGLILPSRSHPTARQDLGPGLRMSGWPWGCEHWVAQGRASALSPLAVQAA